MGRNGRKTMDLGEGGAAPVVLADWLDRLLTSWHNHRVVIWTAFGLAFVFVWLQRRRIRTLQTRGSWPGESELARGERQGAVGDNEQEVSFKHRASTYSRCKSKPSIFYTSGGGWPQTESKRRIGSSKTTRTCLHTTFGLLHIADRNHRTSVEDCAHQT